MQENKQRKRDLSGQKEQGSTLIEAAFGIPVVLSLVFGVVQWGLIIAAQATLTNATATAGRLVAVGSPAYFCNEIRDAAVTAASPYLTGVTCSATGGCSTAPATNTNSTVVTCTYTINLLLPFVVPGNVNGQKLLTASTTAR